VESLFLLVLIFFFFLPGFFSVDSKHVLAWYLFLWRLAVLGPVPIPPNQQPTTNNQQPTSNNQIQIYMTIVTEVTELTCFGNVASWSFDRSMIHVDHVEVSVGVGLDETGLAVD
jgi:hypothetical protein